jgi:hypothetical protein
MPGINLRLHLAQGIGRRLYSRHFISDLLLKFFQTKALFHQLLTSKLS